MRNFPRGWKRFAATAVFAAASFSAAAAQVDAAWRYVAEKLFSPRTHLIYEYRTEGEDGLVRFQPTVEEIARNYPNAAGWHTGMDDGPQLNGPMLIAALARWRKTRDPEAARFAHELAAGIFLCADVAKVPGFLARSVSPRDGRSHYAQSSRDQYTYAVYALWRLYRSDIATEREKADVRRVFTAFAEYAERTVTPATNWSFLREDGGPAYYQQMWTGTFTATYEAKWGLDCFGGIYPHEVMRLPMIYAAAWDVTGDARWRERAVRLVDKGLPMAAGRLPKRISGFALVQMQLSHRLLWEVEPDAARKARLATLFPRVLELAQGTHAFACAKFAAAGGDFTASPGDWRKMPMTVPSDGPEDGVVGGLKYLVPQWPAKLNDAIGCLRESGEMLSAVKLVPGAQVPPSFAADFEKHLSAVDFTRHFTSCPVHMLMGYWL